MNRPLNFNKGDEEFTVNAIQVKQPIGEFLIASIPSKRLCEISYADVRRLDSESRDIESYLGIQRPLVPKRVTELQAYVRTVDACFPTAVILAINSKNAEFDKNTNTLRIYPYVSENENEVSISYENIAKVLDGQHRIAGLAGYQGDDFDVNVSIFIDIDIEDQAYIFSTVNLAQTKVNRSLAYDLSELARSNSPQKTSHNLAVALNQSSNSPLYHRIKRLGTATEGRKMELLTQATFVESLIPFISDNPIIDRDQLKRGEKLPKPNSAELQKMPFREYFIDGNEFAIIDIIFNYFSSVAERWPTAWNIDEKGMILNRTNGFRALMRILRILSVKMRVWEKVPTQKDFAQILSNIDINDDEFNSSNFPPGTSGESAMFNMFKEKIFRQD